MSLAVIAITTRQRSAGGLGTGRLTSSTRRPRKPCERCSPSKPSMAASGSRPAATVPSRRCSADAGYEVVSTDLIAYGYGAHGIDFLTERRMRGKHIVTNPLYGSGLADAFIKHALGLTRQTGGSVAMLLNLASLCHPSRHDFWVGNPPSAIYALDALDCWPCGKPALANYVGGKHRYCWVVWRPKHLGPTGFGWLSPARFAGENLSERRGGGP